MTIHSFSRTIFKDKKKTAFSAVQSKFISQAVQKDAVREARSPGTAGVLGIR
jgi:hypothetical protein